MIMYRTRFLRKLYYPFKPFLKPIIRWLFPGFLKYDTFKYWTMVEGPNYFYSWRIQHENTYLFKLQCKTFINELRKLEFKTILDYGCGYGRILKLIEINFPDRKLYGCDISKHQLKNAKTYLGNASKCVLFYNDGKRIMQRIIHMILYSLLMYYCTKHTI